MSPHRAVIEAGPGTIRRLCCAGSSIADMKLVAAALGAIDDSVVLVDDRPVDVSSVWSGALRSVMCSHHGVTVVHPSWWSATRVSVVAAAAQTVADDAVVRPRSWLLAPASAEPAVVVEIAERLVMVAADEVVGVARGGDPRPVVEEVAGVVADMAADATVAVLVDAPNSVAGAPQLGTLIAGALRDAGWAAVEIGDARLARLARDAPPEPSPRRPDAMVGRSRVGPVAWLAVAGAVLAVPAVATASQAGHRAAMPVAATTSLVEGRVVLTIPASWSTQRVVAGPGSARVQVTSPSDPEVALHVTQSPVAGETLTGTAQRLQRAIDAEPAGVFVDFNPAGISAGRPAVTYREVRAGHDVRWTVLLDGAIRISIGCQSRPAAPDAVHDACEQAVRSAHALE
ncbi:type VII secretion-associated protein [Mycobacterium riyadhense]|uniref:Type VII secretion-associated protein n=1 Tax=Mycobacterium riyadhense TaxID=486698 RepID=A0A1X2D4J8_9MYCO|nr:type VII secretion-associated protein [Mycobacterium riyadhense]MCV7146516.1 type VII secretion-associated protein [Mycobacterium riyadhense]ORW83132.1 Type VII secretion-associated protein [Mycobacterium riyadhense]